MFGEQGSMDGLTCSCVRFEREVALDSPNRRFRQPDRSAMDAGGYAVSVPADAVSDYLMKITILSGSSEVIEQLDDALLAAEAKLLQWEQSADIAVVPANVQRQSGALRYRSDDPGTDLVVAVP